MTVGDEVTTTGWRMLIGMALETDALDQHALHPGHLSESSGYVTPPWHPRQVIRLSTSEEHPCQSASNAIEAYPRS